LRERKEDIPLLARDFIGKLAKKLGKPIINPSVPSMTALQNYSWPGNVRELANVIERAIIDARGDTLDFTDGLDGGFPDVAKSRLSSESPVEQRSLEDLEREFIVETLQRTRGKIEGCDGAARSLGLNPSTLRTRMKKLGIQRQRGGRFIAH
jgi:DNA-binding NtrC family response regulator